MAGSDPPFQDSPSSDAGQSEPVEPAPTATGREESYATSTPAPPADAGIALSAGFAGARDVDAEGRREPPQPSRGQRTRAFLQSHPQPLIERIDRADLKHYAMRAAKVAGIVFCGWFITVLFLIVVYRFVNPPVSSLMAMQWLGGTSIKREWVPLEQISPNLMRAVIVSEDGRFCSHWGIDFGEVLAAVKRAKNGTPRGASTITMQVAKNLFLWPSKSYVRKIIEVPLTYAIELAWPKRRILEIYLNIAEWGPGTFGAEAAARRYFKRPASRLSAAQAARLAVALPNPVARNAARPGRWTRRRAGVIQRRAAGSRSAASCVLPPR
jgi:monofunctional biosynthetic peptidoglycan transglycosylase